jgi:hypothetical protein
LTNDNAFGFEISFVAYIQMVFFADIRKPCEFSVNQNLISYIAEEREMVFTDTEYVVIANRVETLVWSLISTGKQFVLVELILEMLYERTGKMSN